MKLTTTDKTLIVLSALLDALQFAELSYVRQGVTTRPEWWHDAHAVALGLFGLIVAATFAIGFSAITQAAASWRRDLLVACLVTLVVSVTCGLIAGLLGVAGWMLVVPLVTGQVSIYVTVPVASAARVSHVADGVAGGATVAADAVARVSATSQSPLVGIQQVLVVADRPQMPPQTAQEREFEALPVTQATLPPCTPNEAKNGLFAERRCGNPDCRTVLPNGHGSLYCGDRCRKAASRARTRVTRQEVTHA